MKEGSRSLMRGFSATQSREILGNGVYFWSYALLSSALHHQGEKNRTKKSVSGHFVTAILSGGLAGMAFWLLVLPFDVVKTNMQLNESPTFVSLRRAVADVYNQRGWRGFYRGLGTTLIRWGQASNDFTECTHTNLPSR